MAGLLGKIIGVAGTTLGAAVGGAEASRRKHNPVAGAVVGTAVMAVARRVLPRSLVGIGAAVATGYVTRKLAQRAERREQQSTNARPTTRASKRGKSR
ncbi:MAG: hypothetical protein MUF41_01220 [Sphingopyxis sp.]|nr:hypothetical protein [Sphingopyxis sp.]